MSSLDRAARRTARRAARDGTGPTRDQPAANPGAVGAFALLGEVLLTGIVVSALSIPVVTLPAALAAGTRHLRRFVRAEGSPMGTLWRDFLRALPGGALVGVGVAALAAALIVDILLAGSGSLPGGEVIAAAGWVIAALAGGALLLACAAWNRDDGWRRALRSVPSTVQADVTGALYTVAAAAFVGVAGWMLAPLVVPAVGCAVLASVAIPTRRRARA